MILFFPKVSVLADDSETICQIAGRGARVQGTTGESVDCRERGLPIERGYCHARPLITSERAVGKTVEKVDGAYAWKLLPQPHVLVALGFLKTKPRPITSSLKSISVPSR